ncbi:MAG: hypothetical protein LW806_06270 [Planctomycetaceae bacterium]|jgi:hypothetical protein|nr:hypothetical protein [Planctomycetaceae bacterium]
MEATAQTDATTNATLDALSREFATLPLLSLAPALVLLLGGLLLVVAGRHFLRPVLVVTFIAVGALLGAPILGAIEPRFGGTFVGRVVFTGLGAVIGLVAVATLWRLVYGVALGIVVGFGLSLVAWIGIDAGAIDARAPGETPHVAAAPSPQATAFADRTPDPVRPLVTWADARWRSEPPQVRTFLAAAAAGGAFIGLILGAWMPQASAAFLTSLVGGAFTLVGAVPFLARFSERFAGPISPIAWLLLWLALALLGWILQTWRGDPDAEPAPQSPSDRRAQRRDTT